MRAPVERGGKKFLCHMLLTISHMVGNDVGGYTWTKILVADLAHIHCVYVGDLPQQPAFKLTFKTSPISLFRIHYTKAVEGSESSQKPAQQHTNLQDKCSKR